MVLGTGLTITMMHSRPGTIQGFLHIILKGTRRPSMRDITLCHPRLQLLAVQLVEESGKQGLMIKIGETLRTVAEQDALYAQGRTKPGSIVTNAPGSSYSSYHQWGTAFDIFRNDGAGPYNDSGNFFTRVGVHRRGPGPGMGRELEVHCGQTAFPASGLGKQHVRD